MEDKGSLRQRKTSSGSSDVSTGTPTTISGPERPGSGLLAWILAFLAVVATLTLLSIGRGVSAKDAVWRSSPGSCTSGSLKWWQKTIVYQVYPRSFQDSDGNGVGDIKGITERLNYLSDINVNAIWISPIFRSPMLDNGYDVANYTDIDPIFGSLGDFTELLQAAHRRGIKVILDFVPNHSSDQHPWFQQSRRGVAPYKDYYVWVDPPASGERRPPNNWRSLFRGSAWQWDEVRGQYYYHAFMVQQPDLNWRNVALVEEMNNVLRFWLERGVDGFRVDAIQNMFETADVKLNEPPSGKDNDQESWSSLKHVYTFDQPEIGDIVRTWRRVLDEFESKDGFPRFLVTETLSDPDVSIRNRYYGYGADMPFNFDLIVHVNGSCGGTCLQGLVDLELRPLPQGAWPNFVLSNHDNGRLASRVGEVKADAFNLLLLTLPGTPTVYYGEELGMPNVKVTMDQGQDPQALGRDEAYFQRYSRDPERTPMIWDDGHLAGFSSAAKAWLPVSPDYVIRNVKSQLASASPTSLQFFHHVARLREASAFQCGSLYYAVVNDHVFSFLRKGGSAAFFLVAVNIGTAPSTDDYTNHVTCPEGTVVAVTPNLAGQFPQGNKVALSSLTLKPGQGLVVKVYC